MRVAGVVVVTEQEQLIAQRQPSRTHRPAPSVVWTQPAAGWRATWADAHLPPPVGPADPMNISTQLALGRDGSLRIASRGGSLTSCCSFHPDPGEEAGEEGAG